MTHRLQRYAFCALLLAIAGCELQSNEAPGPAGKGIVISESFQTSPSPPGGGAPVAGPAAGPNSGTFQQPAPLPAAPAFPIRLSAGTALPQTGPEGTIMSFSVDYQAGEYRPADDAHWVLVIEAAGGQRVEEPAQIASSGTWALFVNGWAPEAGPFQAHVEEISGAGSRRHVSAQAPLQ